MRDMIINLASKTKNGEFKVELIFVCLASKNYTDFSSQKVIMQDVSDIISPLFFKLFLNLSLLIVLIKYVFKYTQTDKNPDEINNFAKIISKLSQFALEINPELIVES